MELAPIVLFVYNRFENTQILLNALAKNELASESTLYIYADGIQENASKKEVNDIQQVRDLIRSSKWCREVIINESDKNIGLAASIIQGVTEIINKYGKAIILEDDLNLSPYFLSYMNDALQVYQEDKRVGQIGSCNFFANGPKFPPTFFAPAADCWGWATWADRWNKYEYDAEKLLTELKQKGLMKKFNLNNSADMEGMLTAQIKNQFNTWDIQWLAVCILNSWVTLYPNLSTSQHLYLGSATHNTTNLRPPLLSQRFQLKKLDAVVLPEILKAMELGYSGRGDFYGNKVKIKKDIRYFKDRLRKTAFRIKQFFTY
ncbi:hypothetical protein DHW03_16645 [Pedobacter yonginense]|uniref:Glycosyl transferase n=1 Tax=Pedobacter yonginense TaxID=651869 RepID=A0A317EK01_9SPHI|nr:hypothetical protein [Pedobacter yonginense]PWS26409.1 hypothetical protein DHW03_16645 [Pedobacter yonginense]